MRRTAVLIHISSFGAPVRSDDDPMDLLWDDHISKLAREFEECDYVVLYPRSEDGGELRGDEIWPAIERVVTDHNRGDVVVVHILSHGYPNEDRQGLHIAGRDLRQEDGSRYLAPDADVARWLQILLGITDMPFVLLLLDVCFAGKAVDADTVLRIKEPNKLWILAAATGQAYDGRFTRALTHVLRQVHSADPAFTARGFGPYVPLRAFACQVVDTVAKLTGDDIEQQMIGSRASLTVNDALLPFFHNEHPVGVPTPRLDEALSVGPAVTGELAYFLAAVRCHGADDRAQAAFTGRRREREDIVSWLTNHQANAVHLITGRAGTGKSALLGATVCVTHQTIIPHLEKLGLEAPGGPAPQPHTAAISLRHKDVANVIAEIGRQVLGVEDVWSTAVLTQRLTALNRPCFIVLDALDEAIAPSSIVDDLILPLSRVAGPNGTPVIRILVSTRPNTLSSELAEAIPDLPVTDLDRSERRVLNFDVELYARVLLDEVPGYRGDGPEKETRIMLANAIADRLCATNIRPQLGEYLVTRLYVEWLAQRQIVAADRDEGVELGRAVPLLLDELFEKDMQALVDRKWVRPVLAALALSEGEGLPAQLIPPLVAACTEPTGDRPTDREVAVTLDALGRYLTVLPSPDGTTYRLFHDVLVEHLRQHPFADLNGPPVPPDTIFDALLATVPDQHDGDRNWSGATWHVRRFLLQHARTAQQRGEVLLSAGYLLAAEPENRLAIAELDSRPELTDAPDVAAATAVVRRAGSWPRPLATAQIAELAVHAARAGGAALTHVLAAKTGTHLRPDRVLSRTAPTPMPEQPDADVDLVAITPNAGVGASLLSGLQVGQPRTLRPDMTPLAVLEGAELPELVTQNGQWLVEFRSIADPGTVLTRVPLTKPATAATRVDEARVVIATWNCQLYECDGGNPRELRVTPPLSQVPDALTCLPVSAGPPGLAVGSEDGVTILWRNGDGYRQVAHAAMENGRHTVVDLDGRTTVVCCSDNGDTTLIDIASGNIQPGPVRPTPTKVGAMTVLPVEGGPLILLGDSAGELWSWQSNTEEWAYFGSCDGPVSCVTAWQARRARFVAAGTENGEISVWDPTTRTAERTRIDDHVRFLVGWPKSAAENVGVAVAAGFGGLLIAERVTDTTVLTRWISMKDPSVKTANLRMERPVTGLAFAEHGGWAALVVEVNGKPTSAWHPVTARLLSGIPATTVSFSDSVNRLVLLDDRLVSLQPNEDGTLRLSSNQPDSDEWHIVAHAGGVHAVCAWQHGNAPFAVSCGVDRAVRIWHLPTKRLLTETWLPEPANHVVVLPPPIGDTAYRVVAVTSEDIIVFALDAELLGQES